MKLLTLSFSNLNSLKGHWHIDFTHQDFNDGIFAIIGKTGSGKTTILDAICLAIYGRTPRIKEITSAQNDIMSMDQGDCHAQVQLEMDGKMYRFFGVSTVPDIKQGATYKPSNEKSAKSPTFMIMMPSL